MTFQTDARQAIAGNKPAAVGDKLSFIIKVSGEIVPAMPDDEEFSPQQIRDYVAGPPEMCCRTHDGFFFFRNREGKALGLPLNERATRMYMRLTCRTDKLLGRILLVHPDHIFAYKRNET